MSVDPRVRRGAFYFYLIAGLSLLKVLFASGGFFAIPVVSLASVVLVQDIGVMTHQPIFTAASLAFIAAFAALGYFAGRGQRWAFVAGMIVYFLDALLFFSIFQLVALFGLAFHGLMLYRIYSAFSVLSVGMTNRQIFANMEIQRALQRDKEAREFEAAPPPAPYVPPRTLGSPTPPPTGLTSMPVDMSRPLQSDAPAPPSEPQP